MIDHKRGNKRHIFREAYSFSNNVFSRQLLLHGALHVTFRKAKVVPENFYGCARPFNFKTLMIYLRRESDR